MLESRLVGHTYTRDTKNETLGRIPFRDHPIQWEYKKPLAWPARKYTRTNPDVFSKGFCRDMGDEMV